MKIYVATSGRYSDYHIVGLFSTQEKANEFVKHEFAEDIEEWQLDGEYEVVELQNKGYKSYNVDMQKNGDGGFCMEFKATAHYNYKPYLRISGDNLHARIVAKSEEQAIKAVNEKRIVILALNRWKDGEVEL